MTPLTQVWHEQIDGGWWSCLVADDHPTEPGVALHICYASAPDDPELEGDFDSEMLYLSRGARTLQWPPRWPDVGKTALLKALAAHYDWLR